MLSDVLGYSESDPNSPFQLGLQVYLSQHAYGNAATADLWAALQSHAPASLEVTVAELMSSYTDQMGYPLLTLKADAAQPGFLVGTQRRFLELPYDEQDPALRDGQANNKWDVLVRFQEKGQTSDARWMRKADNSVKIPYNGTFIVANKGRAGFYRVNYPAPVWQQIGDALLAKDAFFGNADMCGLLDDVWTLALSGEASYVSAFQLTSFLGNQDFGIYTAWAAAFTNLGRVKALVSSFPDTSQRFNRYVVEKLIGTNVQSLTPWNPLTDHLQALLQQQFIGSLIAYNSTSARAEAARLWAGLVVNGTDVPVDIRDAVYRVGIEDGGDAEWQFLYQRYHSTLDAAEARRTLRALARSLNVTQLSVLLDMSSIPSEVKQQDQTRTIIYVSANPVGQAVAWEWVKTNWNLLYKRFGSQSFALGELVSRVVGQLQTQAALDEARAFFADKPLGSAALALKQAFEAVTVNIFWLRERYAEFDAALKDVVPA
jgi:aminopeptidase N